MSVEIYPAQSREAASATVNGVVIGLLLGFENQQPLVVYPGNPSDQARRARSTCALAESDIGSELALLFEAGDIEKPMVAGKIQRPEPALKETPSAPEEENPLQVSVDGEAVQLKAKEFLQLQCGKASITLTKAGKIILKGHYISSLSTGVQRIKGGSVHIN